MGFALHNMLGRRLNICERIGDTPFHFGLISFQGKYIVGSALDYYLGNLLLTTHRVNGDDAALQFQNTQQFRYGGYLVTLSCNLFLTQQEIVGRSPRADKMGVSSGSVIAASAHTFSVDGNYFTIGQLCDALGPCNKRIVQFLGV